MAPNRSLDATRKQRGAFAIVSESSWWRHSPDPRITFAQLPRAVVAAQDVKRWDTSKRETRDKGAPRNKNILTRQKRRRKNRTRLGRHSRRCVAGAVARLGIRRPRPGGARCQLASAYTCLPRRAHTERQTRRELGVALSLAATAQPRRRRNAGLTRQARANAVMRRTETSDRPFSACDKCDSRRERQRRGER